MANKKNEFYLQDLGNMQQMGANASTPLNFHSSLPLATCHFPLNSESWLISSRTHTHTLNPLTP